MEIEKIITHFLSSVYVVLPCEIVKLNKCYADVKPFVDESDLGFPTIPEVPILTIGNDSKKIKFKHNVGDVVTVLFSQVDFSEFLINKSRIKAENSEKFNLSSAVALPFNIHTMGSEKTAKLDFDIVGDVYIEGKLFVKGNIEQIGTFKNDGEINSTGDVTADTVSLINHQHPYTWTGDPGFGDTSIPTPSATPPVVEEP